MLTNSIFNLPIIVIYRVYEFDYLFKAEIEHSDVIQAQKKNNETKIRLVLFIGRYILSINEALRKFIKR